MEVSDEDYEHFLNSFDELYNLEGIFRKYISAYVCIIFCIGLPGNSFMLRVLLKEQAWRKTFDFLLLQHIASNLCCIVTLPFHACEKLHLWIFGRLAQGFLVGLSELALNSYVLILTSMTLHHYITVVHPLRLPTHISRKLRVRVASILIWLISACPAIKAAVESASSTPRTAFMDLVDFNVGLWLFYVIPLFIVIFCYVHMWIITKQGETNGDYYPSKSFTRIIASSFLCLAPYYINIFVYCLNHMIDIMYNYEWFKVHIYFNFFQVTVTFLCPCLDSMFLIGTERFRRHLRLPCITSQRRRDSGTSDTSVQFMTLNEEDV